MDANKKKIKVPMEKIKRLIPDMGGCYASDRILVDGKQVGFMYRVKPSQLKDSGWRFLAGNESQAYLDDPKNWARYEVNTVCNYDPAIIPYLQAVAGSAFGRVKGADTFEPETLPEDPDKV